MTIKIKMLALGASAAALAAATPAAAQYYQYDNRYNNNVTNLAAQRCAAAVQQRLSYRGGNSGGILGAIFGVNNYSNYSNARVLSVTQVNPNRNTIRVRGIASSGRMAYNPYGSGYYGMLGSNYASAADLNFRCSVDYRGYVRDVDINRR